MTRKIIVIVSILTCLGVAFVATNRNRLEKEEARIVKRIERFAAKSEPHDLDTRENREWVIAMSEGLERQIAAYHGTAVPILKKTLAETDNVLIAAGCARTLGRIEEGGTGAILLEAIQKRLNPKTHDEAFVLASAIHGVGLRYYKPAEALLGKIARDPKSHGWVRQQAILALVRMNGGSFPKSIVILFQDGTSNVMNEILLVARYMSPGQHAPTALLTAFVARATAEEEKPSLRLLTNLMWLAARQTDLDARPLLAKILKWDWSEGAIGANSKNHEQGVGPVDAADLFAALGFALATCGDGTMGMHNLIDRATREPNAIFRSALPEAVKRYARQLKRSGRNEKKRSRANRSARQTLRALLRMQKAEPVGVANQCLRALGGKAFLDDPRVEKFDLWHKPS